MPLIFLAGMSIVYGESALNTFYELHIETTAEESKQLLDGLATMLQVVKGSLEQFLARLHCLKFYIVCCAQMQVYFLFFY